MSFAAAVDHLHALGLELAQDLAPGPAPRRKFDLAHMRVLAGALGSPQQQFPSILIAGTNGKGSTAATLASILAASGLRTGLYTSPHLQRVTERIRIGEPVLRSTFSVDRSEAASAHLSTTNNEQRTTDNRFSEIPEATFARLYFRVDEAARQLVSAGQLPHHPSYFETLTALAFLYFADPDADSQPDASVRRSVDIAVLEVGMGGRLDATNIVEPILSVITDIALDHQDYLGSTIAAIAREKAGILRPGGTLITLPQHPDANQAIGEAAIALNVHALSATGYLPDVVRSPFSVLRSETTLAPAAFDEQRTTDNEQPFLRPNHYDLHLHGETLRVRSPLAGRHQQRNLALAIAAAFEVRNHFSHKLSPVSSQNHPSRNQISYKSRNQQPTTGNQRPFSLNLASIEAGIANTSWPGRLEFLPPNLLLDVAHNPAGAWALRAALATLPDDLPRTLIFSCLRDKNLAEMAQILFPLFDDVLRSSFSDVRSHTANAAPSTDNEQRTTDNVIFAPIDSPRALPVADLLAAARALDIPARAAASPADALALARAHTPPGGLIVATGSIYLIGAIRNAALATLSSSSE